MQLLHCAGQHLKCEIQYKLVYTTRGGSRGVQLVHMHQSEIASYKNSVENISASHSKTFQ